MKAAYISFSDSTIPEDFRSPHVLRVSPRRAAARELAAHHGLVWTTGDDWNSPVERLDLWQRRLSFHFTEIKKHSYLKSEAKRSTTSPMGTLTRPSTLAQAVLGTLPKFLGSRDSSDIEAA